MSYVSSWMNGNTRIYEIEDASKNILEAQHYPTPHYLSAEEIVRYWRFNPKQSPNPKAYLPLYNIEAQAYFPSTKTITRGAQASSVHLVDALQNMVDAVGYLEGLAITLDKEATPRAIRGDQEHFRNTRLETKQNMQEMPNVIPLDTPIDLRVVLFFQETYGHRIPVKYDAHITSPNQPTLWLESGGGASITLQRKHTHELIQEEHTLVGKLTEWFNNKKNPQYTPK